MQCTSRENRCVLHPVPLMWHIITGVHHSRSHHLSCIYLLSSLPVSADSLAAVTAAMVAAVATRRCKSRAANSVEEILC